MQRRTVLHGFATISLLSNVVYSQGTNPMALTKFGFIVTGAQLDPSSSRVVMRSPSFEMIAIGIGSASQGPAVARALVDEGIQLLELCGGFGPVWTARVIEAIDGRVPVGSVGYGPEAITPMYELFK